jgi:hypothetical protein
MNTNNLLLDKNKLNLFLLTIVSILICNCATTGNKWKEKILTEDVIVSVYDFKSREFESMLGMLKDTCHNRYNCEGIDFLFLQVTSKGESLEFLFSNGGNMFGYNNANDKFGILKSTKSLIMINQNDIETIGFFSTAKYQNDFLLKSLLDPSFNDCLYVSKGKNYDKIHISALFVKKKEEQPIIYSFMDLIE